MPKTAGYSRFACDRKGCSAVEHLQETDPRAQAWRRAKRVTADGVETEALLCPDCYPEYKSVAEAADKSYNAYMEGGE